MTRHGIIAAAFAVAACGGSSTASTTNFATTSMIGANEVGAPTRVTNGTGSAEYTVNGTTVHYKVTFNNLTSPATISHIHVGPPTVSGTVVVGFTGVPNATQGTIEGDFTADNISAGSARGVTVKPQDFDAPLAAFQEGDAYTNGHPPTAGAGEMPGAVPRQPQRVSIQR